MQIVARIMELLEPEDAIPHANVVDQLAIRLVADPPMAARVRARLAELRKRHRHSGPSCPRCEGLAAIESRLNG